MRIAKLLAVFSLTFLVTAVLPGQEPKVAPNPKAKDAKLDAKPNRGQLPQNWGQLGLTADQKEKVYTLQAKYNSEIDKLEATIKELKSKLVKERFDILSAEQKKSLEDILRKKAGG